jgi:hypothetical protein
VLAVLAVLGGCGVPRYGVPPRPLQKDEGYFGIEVAWEFGNLSGYRGISLNGHVWYGVGNRDAVGVSLRHDGLPVPTLGYAHYGRTSEADADWTATAHLDVMSTMTHAGPVAEVTGGLVAGSGGSRHAAAIGLALVGSAAGRGEGYGLVPALHYAGQTGEARVGIGWYPGRLRRTVATRMRIWLADPAPAGLVIAAEQIVAIAEDSSSNWRGWTIRLRDGRTVEVRERDPYADCWSCGLSDAHLGRHPAAPGNRVWWIWESTGETDARMWVPASPLGVQRLEFDMEAALAGLEPDGVLRLQQDPDLVGRAVARYGGWWRDLSLGVGWFWYDGP